jgi:hypothetical protein
MSPCGGAMSGRSIHRLVVLVAALLIGATTGYLVPRPLPELSRAEFMAEVQAGHVHRIVIEDREIITGVSTTRGAFRTGFRKIEDAGLPAALRALGVEVGFEKSPFGLI